MSAYTDARGWCERIPATEAYRTTAPLIWDVGRKGSGLTVTVPIGTVFDVSVRWWFAWAASPHDPRFHKAAALHDHLLRQGWDRLTAGAVFHAGLIADGVPRWRRFAMWFAVSAFRFQ